MKTVVKIGLLATTLMLGACASAAISDIATDKVKVQTSVDNLEMATSEAVRGCSIYKRQPVYLSKRQIPNGTILPPYEFLFACMAPGSANVSVQ
ncbi:hypothetical protein SAMN02990966_03954 [Rhodospirillales bacterium URHD0017]|nr:hypothetical protein SAMN02990966_03954 [Rhodospirillales bacterium URHD0017]